MKYYQLLAVGLAFIGICPTQSHAQPGILAGITKSNPAPAVTKVQFKLPFGMSARKAREMLSRDGYEEIDVTYTGLIDARAEACRKGIRYKIKIRTDGSYEYRDEIGKCRAIIRADAVDDILRREGYEKIDLNDDAVAPYDVTACRRGDRFDLEVDQYGDVKVKGNRGRCEADMLSPRQVRRALRKDGFDRIKFIDRTPPQYVIEACRNGNRSRLVIDRRGKARRPERIGNCAPEIKPDDIAGILAKAGYDRIDVVDSKPPRYRAEACNAKNDRMRIAISPWGERTRERKIGDCTPPATVASLTDQLRKSRNITLLRVREDGRNGFVADVCSSNKDRHEVYFTRWGEFKNTKQVGRCVSPRIEEIFARFDKDGMKDMQTFVEGCSKRGNRVRVAIDEFGNELNRDRIGRCK